MADYLPTKRYILRTMQSDLQALAAGQVPRAIPKEIIIEQPKEVIPEQAPKEWKGLGQLKEIPEALPPPEFAPPPQPSAPIAPKPTFAAPAEKPAFNFLLILLVIILLGGAGYSIYYFYTRPKPIEITTQQPPTTPTPPEIQTPILPTSYLGDIENQIIDFKTNQGYKIFDLIKLSKNNTEINRFSRLLFRENSERGGIFLTFQNFFDRAEISVPFAFVDNFEENFTAFLYKQSEGDKFGFVAKIKDGKLTLLKNQLARWEEGMAQDLKKFYFSSIPIPPIGAFKTAKFNKTHSYRYLNFGTAQSRLHYAILEDKNFFVLTTSEKSLKAALTLLLTGSSASSSQVK